MAEAIAKDLGHTASSAGTHPPENGEVAKNAIAALDEIGVETAELYPKSVDAIDPNQFDMIISMGCGVSCPTLPIDRDWGLEDPYGLEMGAYRKTRDRIRVLISGLPIVDTDA